MSGITWNWTDARRGFVVAVPTLPLAAAATLSLGVVFALGTLPVKTSAFGPSVAVNTKGSTSGGRTWSLKTVRPVGIGPASAFFTSA